MPWNNSMPNFASGSVLEEVDLDKLTENLAYLKSPPSVIKNINEASDYTTSSATFANIDSTNLSVAIAVPEGGGEIEFTFNGVVSVNTAGTARQIAFDILQVGGPRLAGDDGIIGIRTTLSGTYFPISFTYYTVALTAGTTITYRLQWRVTGDTATLYAGAAASLADWHPQFSGRMVH